MGDYNSDKSVDELDSISAGFAKTTGVVVQDPNDTDRVGVTTAQKVAETGLDINGMDAKTTPVDADLGLIEDSAASWTKKKLSWSSIKTTLKSYFDTIYSTITHASQHTNGTDDIQNATSVQKGLMTSAYASKVDGIEENADVTDSTNVAAAGAVMDSDYTAKGDILVGTGAGTQSPLSIGTNDHVLMADSGEASGTKWAEITQGGAGSDTDAIHDNVSGEIQAITEKTTPVDADLTLIEDSAASWIKKKLSWSNIKATLKTYLDGLYAAKGANADITSMTALTQITRATGGAFDIAIGGAEGDNFTVDSTKVIVEGDTGNVGLGMTPLEKLSVNGRLTGTGLSRGAADKSFNFAGGTTDADGGNVALYGESHASAADQVRINTNAIVVLQDKKVGFGVYDPGDVIDVNGRIRMRESSDPGAVADRGWIYTKDVGGTAEVFASDAAANNQQLTPHAFELFEPDPDEPYPWSYYAENKALGIRINVDMAGAIRVIEGLTGKQFIYYEDIEKTVDLESNYCDAWKKEWIKENTIEEEVSRNDAFALVEVEVQGEKIGQKIVGYELEGTIVKEIKEPVYETKKEFQYRLKAGISFNENDGKFYRKIIPSESEIAEAVETGFSFTPPAWMVQRLKVK